MKNDFIYADHNSSGYIMPEVQNVVNELMALPLNPSSIHYLGQKASGFIEDTRDFIKEYFNCYKSHNVLFLSSGSEASNMAINYLKFHDGSDFDLWVCTTGEHKSVLYPIQKQTNHFISPINEDGVINREILYQFLRDNSEKKIFLSLIYANNETGAINNLQEIIPEIRKIHDKVVIHSDFGQVIGKCDYGKFPIDIQKLDLDLITIIGYKFGALQGSSALIYRKNLTLIPMILGGSQESNLRAGTENVISIYSMKVALENQKSYEDVMKLRNYFEGGLKKIVESNKLVIFSKNTPRICNTSYFAIDGIESKTQLMYFNQYKIYLGSGSACSAGLDEDSHVLISMGFDEKIRKSAVRASFGCNNSVSDIDKILHRMQELYDKFVRKN